MEPKEELTVEEEAQKAENFFRERLAQRMSKKELEDDIRGEPSEHIKKMIHISRITEEVILILYDEGSKTVIELVEKFSGEDLAEATDILEKKGLVELGFTEKLFGYVKITEKGKKLIREKKKKAEESRKIFS